MNLIVNAGLSDVMDAAAGPQWAPRRQQPTVNILTPEQRLGMSLDDQIQLDFVGFESAASA